ncbi:MAG: glutathione S-transferase family protein [Natronohydrobacter sp.]|nr:glutathione S-transferase family protein [Natronohydrobacter sp.]
MRLFNMPSSGNSYKVRLLLALLGLKADLIDVEYGWETLAQAKADGKLPFGKAPVLELEDGTLLPESNAILCYLGQGTPLMPADGLDHARMLSWMFWEQNQHEGVIAVRAALLNYPHRKAQATPDRLTELLASGQVLLKIMDDHLATHDWLVGNAPSLADICLYAYTHTAEERGGFDLAPFPALRAWLARVVTLPGYVGLDD